jgi:hypothetical protein
MNGQVSVDLTSTWLEVSSRDVVPLEPGNLMYIEIDNSVEIITRNKRARKL